MIKRPNKHFKPRRPYHGGNNNEAEFSDSEERLDYRPQRPRVHLQQSIDRYLNQAREAMGAGDRVLAENYLQHADHFTRLLNEQNAQRPAPQQQPPQQQRQNDIINELPKPAVRSPVNKEPVVIETPEPVATPELKAEELKTEEAKIEMSQEASESKEPKPIKRHRRVKPNHEETPSS